MADRNRRDMTALGELVELRRSALGKSLRVVATDAGLSLAFTHKIAKGQLLSFPTPRTIEGLATALELPEQTIIDAAGSDVGTKAMVVSAEADLHAIYYGAEELDKEERALVIAIINKFRRDKLSVASVKSGH